jgi:hypothetical protein
VISAIAPIDTVSNHAFICASKSAWVDAVNVLTCRDATHAHHALIAVFIFGIDAFFIFFIFPDFGFFPMPAFRMAAATA